MALTPVRSPTTSAPRWVPTSIPPRRSGRTVWSPARSTTARITRATASSTAAARSPGRGPSTAPGTAGVCGTRNGRRRSPAFTPLPLVVLLGSGCARPVAPALRPGDVVRPEIAFAPRDPWPPEAAVALGMLVKVHRPGGEARYLGDKDVSPENAAMRATVTFL